MGHRLLRVEYGPGWEAERRYAAAVMLGEYLGLEYTEVGTSDVTEITLAGDPERKRLVVRDGLFAFPDSARLGVETLPVSPVQTWDLGASGVDACVTSPQLPLVFGGEGSDAAQISPVLVELGVDLFGASFFFLTRYEEVVTSVRDEHGRFPDEASFSTIAGLTDRPLVNEYGEVLWWALHKLWPRLERKRRAFRLLPSHDVDWPDARGFGIRSVCRALAADVLFRRDPELAARRAAGFFSSRVSTGGDLYDTFDFIMDLSDAAGIRSAFNFMAVASPDRLDGVYSPDESWIRRLLRRVHDRGHEIGVHPSYASYADAPRIASEAERLRTACRAEGIEQGIWGGRQHYLRWENPTTWRAWDEAGLDYDSTLGFNGRPGFRTGACFEYPVFDVLARRQLRLRERPLIVMEVPLLGARRIDVERVVEEVEQFEMPCRVLGGDFTLLWHNSRLLSRPERESYSRIVVSSERQVS